MLIFQGVKRLGLTKTPFFFRLCRGNGMASFWQDRYEEWLEQMGDTPLGTPFALFSIVENDMLMYTQLRYDQLIYSTKKGGSSIY